MSPDSIRAQVPEVLRVDTLRADTDTLAIAEDDAPRAVRPGDLLPLPVFDVGRAVGDTLPTLKPVMAATELLGQMPGAFVYDLGAVGWPHGWSPLGLSPQRPSLLLDGLPFDDPLTGRPRYDLLPLDLLQPLRVGPGALGAPLGAYAALRPLSTGRPLTELRYRRGSAGQQSVSVLHTQRRRLTLFDTPAALEVLGVYGGGAADNEYPGSRLTRQRRLYGRLRYRRPTWSLTLSDLHNRRFLGAHGGVLPSEPDSFITIYDRAFAEVLHPDARRRTIRNDLALTLRARLLPGTVTGAEAPLTASAYWTAQTFRYRGPDTLEAQTDRYGLRLMQEARRGAHRLRLTVQGYVDRWHAGSALPDSTGRSRTRLSATLRDALALGGGLRLRLAGGLFAGEGRVAPTATFGLTQRLGGSARLFAEAALAAQPVPWIARHGFGDAVEPLETMPAGPAGRVLRGRVGLGLAAGPFDVKLFAFGHQIDEPIDFYTVSEGTASEAAVVEAAVAPAPFRRAGLAGRVGWRAEAERGFYATVQGAALRFLNPDASALHRRVAAALPNLYGRVRLGARYELFRGDLDFDLYLQSRFWTRMQSRTLHPPTGLLVAPDPRSRIFGPSSVLDVHFEAQVRTATLFLSYENALSGTRLQVGTLIVPVYPLPEQQFRFGVYWPIFN